MVNHYRGIHIVAYDLYDLQKKMKYNKLNTTFYTTRSLIDCCAKFKEKFNEMVLVTDKNNETLRCICTTDRKSVDHIKNPLDLEITLPHVTSIGEKLMPEENWTSFSLDDLHVKGDPSNFDESSQYSRRFSGKRVKSGNLDTLHLPKNDFEKLKK